MSVSLAMDLGRLAIRLCPASTILKRFKVPSSSGKARNWLFATMSTCKSVSCAMSAGRVLSLLRNRLRTRSDLFRQTRGGTAVSSRPLRSSLPRSGGCVGIQIPILSALAFALRVGDMDDNLRVRVDCGTVAGHLQQENCAFGLLFYLGSID